MRLLSLSLSLTEEVLAFKPSHGCTRSSVVGDDDVVLKLVSLDSNQHVAFVIRDDTYVSGFNLQDVSFLKQHYVSSLCARNTCSEGGDEWKILSYFHDQGYPRFVGSVWISHDDDDSRPCGCLMVFRRYNGCLFLLLVEHRDSATTGHEIFHALFGPHRVT